MDIKGRDLGLLSSLSVLLEEGNVTRAAVRLGLSQPALSAQLARLRDLFGDELLMPSPTGKGMLLTARGLALQEPLAMALQSIDSAVRIPSTFDPLKAERVFSIATNDNAGSILGVRLVQEVCRPEFQGLSLSFRSADPSALPEWLEAGQLDVALVSRGAVPKGYLHAPLIDEEFRMAQRRGHPRGTSSPTIEEFSQLKHVVVSTSGGFKGFVDDVLVAKGFERVACVSVQYYGLVPAILEATDLVCTLPARFLSKFSDKLDSFPVPVEIPQFTLYATWHPRFNSDPGLVWLLDRLQVCAELKDER
ncbi:LysR family transcriptional regulator [Agrobacterium vitis]|nr:LysR family transcriptional regulator [Agrobacterium vitis]